MTRLIAPAVAALVLTACGGDEPPKDTAQDMEKAVAEAAAKAPETVEEAISSVVEAFGGEKVDTVPVKALRDMLPDELIGMKRTDITASKNSAMGITISSAEAKYEGNDPEDYQTLTINIQDIGSMQTVARMGLGWLNAETYTENEDGFNRTVEYRGHKGVETFEDNGASARGNKMVFVAERFLIDINTKNLPFEKIDDVLETLPIDDLEKMAGT